LAFEAYVWFGELQKHGLQTGTYFAALVWLFAVASASVLLIGSVRRSRITAFIASGLALLAVLPLSGFLDPGAGTDCAPKSALVRNDMYVDGRIEPAGQDISQADKALISDAAFFLLYNEGWQADWFSESLDAASDFARVFGFPYSKDDQGEPQPARQAISLILPVGTLPVGAYEQAAFVMFKEESETLAVFLHAVGPLHGSFKPAQDHSTTPCDREKRPEIADAGLEAWLGELAGATREPRAGVAFNEMFYSTVRARSNDHRLSEHLHGVVRCEISERTYIPPAPGGVPGSGQTLMTGAFRRQDQDCCNSPWPPRWRLPDPGQARDRV
jgi:hypothetical protein